MIVGYSTNDGDWRELHEHEHAEDPDDLMHPEGHYKLAPSDIGHHLDAWHHVHVGAMQAHEALDVIARGLGVITERGQDGLHVRLSDGSLLTLWSEGWELTKPGV